jgi:hypothetical protein
MADAAKGDYFDWGIIDVLKWEAPPIFGGDPNHLRNFKSTWVKFHGIEIVRYADAYHIPKLLLAGVAWIEVGGDPDWIDSVAHKVRTFDHLGAPYLEPITITKKPKLTSAGDVSIQIRRAAETLGWDSKNLTEKQQRKLIEILKNETANLAIVANHLWQLSKIDYLGKPLDNDEAIRIIGTRYNRGPHLSLEQIKQNTSYGDFIIRHKKMILDLIKYF